MLPSDLNADHFAKYPPQAKALAVGHVKTLQQLPLTFAPSLLREVIEYDYKFPAERTAIDREIGKLNSLSPTQRNDWFHDFAQISLSPDLEHFDWVNQPGQFVEKLAAYLWTTHQLDNFRKAATSYGDRLQKAVPPEVPAMRRLGVAVIGQGVASYDAQLFRNLRPHGAYFTRVKPENGLSLLLNGIAQRAKEHPVPYGHWYIDGGLPADHSPSLTSISYDGIAPVRAALLRTIDTEIRRPGMGPEELSTHLAHLTPADLGLDNTTDEVLGRFQVKILTEGSGTQIYSTTFAQWTTREVLRRAQPLTHLVRFAPRQRQKPMNELLSNASPRAELDLAGSVVDADMGSYYNWLNQQRLPGAEQSGFLVWFEGHSQALAIGPSIPKGTESNTVADLSELMALVAV